jgi:nucleotide-binding universal stress UspA family protein
MGDVREIAAGYDVSIETSTLVSHRSFEEIFDAAERKDADLVVLGWGRDKLWDAARTDRALNELTHRLPCDFLVVRDQDQGFDTSRVLLPTGGGPDSNLSAEVAVALRATFGSEITLLHVVDGPDDRPAGERFLESWAADQGLKDATLIVDDSGDVEEAIAREARAHTTVLVGATEKGLLSRLVSGSLSFDVVDRIDTSVLLAERPSDRSLRERLFGGR